MNIYISGISGTGMGPLALMAKSAGMEVFGSDLAGGAVTGELADAGIKVYLGEQNGEFLKARAKDEGIDWFVYTSALPEDHPELLLAKKLKLKTSKRDEFLNFLITKMKLKLVAVAGTHGKTTTTAMIVWLLKQLGLPISYSVGTTLPFAPAGAYDPKSKFFVYEADEYDRNFLSFKPWLAIIPTLSYDHPDIYATEEDYRAAFEQFEKQSREVMHGNEIAAGIDLAGEARRYDATLAIDAVERMLPEQKKISKIFRNRHKQLVKIMNEFPGIGRRFEQISEGYYSDYAHHPEEVRATVEIALEEADRRGLRGVVVVYEPHQNSRQVGLADEYVDAFQGVKKLYWLPTYLARENAEVKIMQPVDFIKKLSNAKVAEPAELDEKLATELKDWHKKGYLVLLMSAGSADKWMRKMVYAKNQESAATRLVHAPRTAEDGSERMMQ